MPPRAHSNLVPGDILDGEHVQALALVHVLESVAADLTPGTPVTCSIDHHVHPDKHVVTCVFTVPRATADNGDDARD
jgi:hypothetical protein